MTDDAAVGAAGSPQRLAGRVAIVTGGGAGIGRGIALAFAREGASVALLDRDQSSAREVAEELQLAGASACSFACDVRNDADVQDAVESTVRQFRRIDVLVNNAGITTISPFRELTLAQWNETIDVDLTGVFLMTRAVIPRMIERGSGKVINIASQLALRGAPEMAHYCAAKAGVLGLTRALARELISFGIHVNAIAPGPTLTANLAGVPENVLERIRGELPIGRFARVEEIAPTAVLLASADGDYYVGATLNVSGGHVV